MADDKKDKTGGEEKGTESKISNTEWGMVIGVLCMIDVVQFGLDLLFEIGVIANRFIDLLVGMAWPTYLYLRGVNLKSVKTAGSIILTFFLEEIPDVDALPLWCADGVFVMLTAKAEEKIKKETGVDVEKAAALAEGGEAAAGETGAGAGADGGGESSAEVPGAAAEGGGETGEGAEGGGGFSGEYADAMGQESDAAGQEKESDNPYGDETAEEKNARMAGDEGDQKHQIGDEEAEDLAKQSDANTGEGGDKDKDKDNKKKKPQNQERRGGGFFGGGGRKGRDTGNDLDLRDRNANRYRTPEENAREAELGAFSNLIDLSDPYAARKKKQQQGKNDETSFPT